MMTMRFHLLLAGAFLSLSVATAETISEIEHVSDEHGAVDGISQTVGIRNRLREQDHDSGGEFDWLGLDVAISYDVAAMAGDSFGGVAGDAALSLRWKLDPFDRVSAPVIAARVRNRHDIGGSTPAGLRSETGALWGYVDGFNDTGTEVPELYLEQRLFEKKLLFRIGQMAIDDLLDDHRLRSPKRSFMNQAFSSSPAVGFPGSGLGLVTRWKTDGGWDLTLAASNIESTNLNDEANWRFSSEAMFQGLQIGRTFQGLADRPARVQLMGWNADALESYHVPAGRGASVTVEQRWSDQQTTYLRYGWADGDAAPTDQLIAAGWSKASGDKGANRVGVGLAAGRSSIDSSRWQGVLEMFYRHQLGPLHVTPDLQLSVGDGLGGKEDWLLLFGLRVGMTF